MLNNELTPLTRYLATLERHDLTANQLKLLLIIIEQLFKVLDSGDSCLNLPQFTKLFNLPSTKVKILLEKSSLVAIVTDINVPIPAAPFILLNINGYDPLLYVNKYLVYEKNIAVKIKQLSQDVPISNSIAYADALKLLTQFSTAFNLPNKEQLAAITNCINQKLSIISGGPGTGKTTTITLLLWFYQQLYGQNLTVKICAPTGKAASRVKQSILGNIDYLIQQNFPADQLNFLFEDNSNFNTIHKLLGTIRNNIYFKHNAQNSLPVDILIIDESSMISLPLFAKLLDAIDSQVIRHVIFLGDKNQLSSVEEGYVFASLINANNNQTKQINHDLFSQTESTQTVNFLLESKRNSELIANFAQLVLNQDVGKIDSLFDPKTPYLQRYMPNLRNILRDLFNENEGSLANYFTYIKQHAENLPDSQELFAQFNQRVILTATNLGLLGAENLNRQIEKVVRNRYFTDDLWYCGRPILIIENDYNNDLYNGDIGICWIKDAKVRVVFADGREFIPEVLPHYIVAYALTIHKSQGSEYEHVNIILADLVDSYAQNLLSCELIYTAITRAKNSLVIYSDSRTLNTAVLNKTVRVSGLEALLNRAEFNNN